jgi:RNase P/RNase MRP subunit POP5
LPATPLQAIVDWKQRQLRTQEGILSVSRASVAFLNVQALSTATNGEGVNDEDIIVLPDGTTGPILDMGGFIDAGTGHPVATEVYLG